MDLDSFNEPGILVLVDLILSSEALTLLLGAVATSPVELSGDNKSGVGARCCAVSLSMLSFWIVLVLVLPSENDESSFLPLIFPNSPSSPPSSSAGLSTMVARGAFFKEERRLASCSWT